MDELAVLLKSFIIPRLDFLEKSDTWLRKDTSMKIIRGASEWYAHNEYVLLRNLYDYVFKWYFSTMWYFASEELCIFALLTFLAECGTDAAFLLFLSLVSCLTNFLRGLSVPGETPLKYHVENNSLSNSHFSLCGWFRRNMHETEASGVKWEKKRWCNSLKYFSFFFFLLNRRYVSFNWNCKFVKFCHVSILDYIAV